MINNVNNLDILNLDEMAVQEEVDAAILEEGECDGEDVEAGEDEEGEEPPKPVAPVPRTFLPFDDPLFDLPEVEEESAFVEVSSPAVASSVEHTQPSELSAANIISEIHDNNSVREEVTSLDLEYEQYELQRTHIAAAEEEKAAISPHVEDTSTSVSVEYQSIDVANTTPVAHDSNSFFEDGHITAGSIEILSRPIYTHT